MREVVARRHVVGVPSGRESEVRVDSQRAQTALVALAIEEADRRRGQDLDRSVTGPRVRARAGA